MFLGTICLEKCFPNFYSEVVSVSVIVACPSFDPGCFRTPQNSAVAGILGFWDPLIFWSWVCQSSWESSCLWDPEILVWPSSWDSVVSELLGVKLLLGIAVMGGKPVIKVCDTYYFWWYMFLLILVVVTYVRYIPVRSNEKHIVLNL